MDLATKELQSVILTMYDAISLLNSVMEDFPETGYRLSPDADIVHSEIFEKVVIKIQERKEGMMNSEEIAAVKPISTVRTFKACDETEVEGLLYAQKVLKKRTL